MRTSIVLGIGAIALTACGTPQERAAYREDPVNAMAQEYGPACAKLGYAKDSDQWRHCVMRSSTRADLVQQGLFYDRYMQWYWLR